MRNAMRVLVLLIGLMAAGLWTTAGTETNLAWRVSGGWPGELSSTQVVGVSGRVNQLKATAAGSQYAGKCFYISREKFPWGHKFRYTARVRGKGELRLGVLKHLLSPGQSLRGNTEWSDLTYPLSDEWRDVTYEFLADDPDISRVGVVVEVSGGENAAVDMAGETLQSLETPGVTLTTSPLPPHPITEAGKPLPEITFLLLENDRPLADKPLAILMDGQIVERVTDREGKVVYQPPADIKSIAVTNPGSGVVIRASIDVLPSQQYKAFDAIASGIQLDKPVHLLIIGDSLSDFDRGSNYVDKLNFWLNRYNPGKADFRNAGVGGDYITRSLDRLSGRPAHRKEMYDGLFDKEADYIFIFLGHNDTRSTSDDNHEKPLVDPETQEKAYREFIALLQSQSGAKIVLVSPTSSNYELCKANAEKAAAAGQKQILFGDPEKLEVFNDVLLRLADELDLDYIDVYSPTRDAPDKASLFYPADGVHLSEAGHRLISLQLLKYMQEHRQSFQ